MLWYWGLREAIDEASMLTSVMITYCLLNTLKNYYNTLKFLKTVLKLEKKPLQRLENLPVSRDLVTGPRVFEPHLRGLQARAQGVHPALERHCFQSAAKLAPTNNSHMTVSCACNHWPVAAECMQ